MTGKIEILTFLHIYDYNLRIYEAFFLKNIDKFEIILEDIVPKSMFKIRIS